MNSGNQNVRRPLPLRPSSLREQVRDTIRRQIQHGEIGRDDRLVDVDIAERLGVSRMPVREALLQLVNEGYLVGTTRGFVLPKLSLRDITDIFEIRKLLEPRAAAHATRNLSHEAEASLLAAVQRAERAQTVGDVDELTLANIQFRQTWLAAEPNWRLAATISRFADQVQTVRLGTLHDPDTQKIVLDGLKQLLDAFVRRDATQVEALMAEFIGHAEARFFAVRAKEIAESETETARLAT